MSAPHRFKAPGAQSSRRRLNDAAREARSARRAIKAREPGAVGRVAALLVTMTETARAAVAQLERYGRAAKVKP